MLKISDLHFSYSKHSHEILKGIDLDLDKGKIGILLGKNGMGKTTLFSNILGINKPSSGEIFISSQKFSEMTKKERAGKIAYVPQILSFGSLSVFDCILTGRISYFGIYPDAHDRDIVNNVIEEMGLSSIADRPADRLSGGEKQKVAIARAIAQQPELMIFDEPTGNLDLANEFLLTSEIKRLVKERNMTVLMALHDLNTALALGDRFFFMKDGIIINTCEKTEINEDIINKTFDVNIKIKEIENKKIILGGI